MIQTSHPRIANVRRGGGRGRRVNRYLREHGIVEVRKLLEFAVGCIGRRIHRFIWRIEWYVGRGGRKREEEVLGFAHRNAPLVKRKWPKMANANEGREASRRHAREETHVLAQGLLIEEKIIKIAEELTVYLLYLY